METIEVTLFCYYELTETAKARARSVWRSREIESYYVTEGIKELFQRVLYTLGYSAEYLGRKISGVTARFSIGYNQKDGVTFEGDHFEDLKCVAKRVLPKEVYDLLVYEHQSGELAGWAVIDCCSMSIVNLYRYTYRDTFVATMATKNLEHFTSEQSEAVLMLETGIREELVMLAQQLEEEGYKIIEYCDSSEFIAKRIETTMKGECFLENGSFA